MEVVKLLKNNLIFQKSFAQGITPATPMGHVMQKQDFVPVFQAFMEKDVKVSSGVLLYFI